VTPKFRKFVGRKFQNGTAWIGLNLVIPRIFGYISNKTARSKQPAASNTNDQTLAR